MKLEVGMYARTRSGYIDKIVDITYNDNYNSEPLKVLLQKNKGYIEQKEVNVVHKDNTTYIENKPSSYWFFASSIIKASHNIIDLIEVGDVIEWQFKYDDDEESYISEVEQSFEKEITFLGDKYELRDIHITRVLTHEVFEREAYKVE